MPLRGVGQREYMSVRQRAGAIFFWLSGALLAATLAWMLTWPP